MHASPCDHDSVLGVQDSVALLSRSAEFLELHCRLSPEQVQLYDAAVGFWQVGGPNSHLHLMPLQNCRLGRYTAFWSAECETPFRLSLSPSSLPRCGCCVGRQAGCTSNITAMSLYALQDLRASLDQALEQTSVKKRSVWRQFWRTHQRFFQLLCISLKVRQASIKCSVSSP